jgi:hypothetical protein
MIIDKYKHLETPKDILDMLDATAKTSKKESQFNYKNHYELSNDPLKFLRDSLSYKNEKGLKSNVIPFRVFFPTFESLDPYRKKFYFYWRDQVTKGNFIETELSYIFLFCYELINYGYNPKASFNVSMLVHLYENYKFRYPKLEKYLPNWIFDFLYEVEDYELASEWSVSGQEFDDEYYALKSNEGNIKKISMVVWWSYIPKRNRSHFFSNEKQKIYAAFKEILEYLNSQYLLENPEHGIFERLFPYKNILISKELYISALLSRNVPPKSIKVNKRTLDNEYCNLLGQLMRIAENSVRGKMNEETFILVDNDIIDNELEEELYEYLSSFEKKNRFVKMSDSATNNTGEAIPPKFELDFDRIETLTKGSEELKDVFLEKYGDTDTEEIISPKEGRETEKVNVTPPLFAEDTSEDFEGFINSLTSFEKKFLLLVHNEGLSVSKANALLKDQGVMFGTFMITLNEKSEEFLNDVLIEEDGEEFEITDEFIHLFKLI